MYKTLILLLFISTSLFSQTPAENILKQKFGRYKKLDNNRYLTFQNNKSGIIDSTGKEIVPFKYTRLDYQNGLLIAELNSNQGLLTLNNEVVTPIEFTWVLPRKNNRFVVRQNSGWGVIDNKNNVIIPVLYSHIRTHLEDYYIVRNENGLNGLYSYTGDNILTEKFIFYTVDRNKIFCTENGKPLIIDFEDPSKTVRLDDNITFKETFVHSTMNELFHQIFCINGKYGLLHSNNEILIPAIYDELSNLFDGSIYLVKLNGKYGIISYKNKFVRDIKYDAAQVKKEIIVLKQKGVKDEYYNIESQQ